MNEKIPGTILTYDGADGRHNNIPHGRFSGEVLGLQGSYVMVDWSGQITYAHWEQEDGPTLFWLAGQGGGVR